MLPATMPVIVVPAALVAISITVIGGSRRIDDRRRRLIDDGRLLQIYRRWHAKEDADVYMGHGGAGSTRGEEACCE
jgi:hypothetical protein